MKTYDDLIRDLFKLGREDAVQKLGELYDEGHMDVRRNVDGGKRDISTGRLLAGTMYWDTTPQGEEYWRDIHHELGRFL